MNKIADYQIFVASSLKLVEYRKAVADATEQYNKEHPGTFYCWEYEYSDIEQTLDQQDAQGPIQEKLIISPIFFLIIEENIKPLTRSEFEMALELFKKKEMPRYIYIFRKENAAEESTADNAWTYKYFKDQYNLNTCRADRFGELEIGRAHV